MIFRGLSEQDYPNTYEVVDTLLMSLVQVYLERNIIIMDDILDKLYRVMKITCKDDDIYSLNRVGYGWYAPIRICFTNTEIKRIVMNNKFGIAHAVYKNPIWIQHDEPKAIRDEKRRVLAIAENHDLTVIAITRPNHNRR